MAIWVNGSPSRNGLLLRRTLRDAHSARKQWANSRQIKYTLRKGIGYEMKTTLCSTISHTDMGVVKTITAFLFLDDLSGSLKISNMKNHTISGFLGKSVL